MQGMQQLFRQHTLDKQASVDDWQHAQSAVASRAHLAQHYGQHHPKLNGRSVSEDSQGSDLSPTSKQFDSLSSTNSSDWRSFLSLAEKNLTLLSSSPQPVPNAFQKSPTHETRSWLKNSPDNRSSYGRSPLFLSLRKPSANRKASLMERSISPVYQVYNDSEMWCMSVHSPVKSSRYSHRVAVHSMVTIRRRSTAATSPTTLTISTSTKRTINTSPTRVATVLPTNNR
jgi:hypothetical protein